MPIEMILAVIYGFFAGIVVNLLADELPYRRNLALPVYPDGTPRPILAWSGIVAFAMGQRSPASAKPNEARARIDHERNQLSWRYPITEIATILLSMVAVSTSQQMEGATSLQTIFYALYAAIFILITVIDVEHKLILFVVIIPSIVLGLVDAFLQPQIGPNLRNAVYGGALGFIVFFVIYLGGFQFTKIMGRMRGTEIKTVAFGYGDVMMITFSGVLLGVAHIYFALFITIFLGAGGAIIFLIAKQLLAGRYQAFTAIPYGPYIVIATALMLFYGTTVQLAIWGWA